MKTEKRQLLKVAGITKTYPGVTALDALDFDLYEGEVHCLVGENGAGKSTFIEILAGSIQPDQGTVSIFDQTYHHFTPTVSLNLGIQTIHQENQLIEDLTVAENIFLRDLKTNNARFFSLWRCVKEADALLNSLGIWISSRMKVSALSPAEKKIVCVAKALSERGKVVMMDEPTASLDEQGKEILFKIIRDIAARQVSVIYISHNLDEIFEVGERITVLKDGKKIATHRCDEVQKDHIVSEMIGRSTGLLYNKRPIAVRDNGLHVKGYSRKGVIEDVSFEVKCGEIFGIGGMVGSGRTELARLIFGLDQKDAGQLIFRGQDITPNTPWEAIHNGIGFLTEDRKETGLVLSRPIYENISVVKLLKSKVAFLNLPQEQEEVTHIAKKLNIVTPTVEKKVINLSGGNQQKVVVAKWMLANSNIIIFDEPTLGIDIGAKREIYDLMHDLLEEGKVIIMISSDMPELISISDRIGIMRNGSMIKVLAGSEKTEEHTLRYSIGAINA